MGEAARRKSVKGKSVLEGEARCIYCDQPPTTVEHMPPRTMFRDKSRPDGMVFASCAACNNGTSTADLVSGFICRIRMEGTVTDWQLVESYNQLTGIGKKAPDFIREFFHPAKNRHAWRRSASGLMRPTVEIRADGPVTKAYLSTFASKFGMALFREHTGSPLPMYGKVFTQWFSNAGLSQQTADAILRILPEQATLVQGKWQVGEQFTYRYNTDEKTVVAALAYFQGGLFVHTIATTTPDRIIFFTEPGMTGRPTDAIAAPGDLLKMMPTRSVLLS